MVDSEEYLHGLLHITSNTVDSSSGAPNLQGEKNTVSHSNPERSLSQPPPVGGLRLSSSSLLQAKSKLIMAAVTHRRHSICCGERRDTVWGKRSGGGDWQCVNGNCGRWSGTVHWGMWPTTLPSDTHLCMRSSDKICFERWDPNPLWLWYA